MSTMPICTEESKLLFKCSVYNATKIKITGVNQSVKIKFSWIFISLCPNLISKIKKYIFNRESNSYPFDTKIHSIM